MIHYMLGLPWPLKQLRKLSASNADHALVTARDLHRVVSECQHFVFAVVQMGEEYYHARDCSKALMSVLWLLLYSLYI